MFLFFILIKLIFFKNIWRQPHVNVGVRKIAPRSGSGFGLELALELGLGGNFPRTVYVKAIKLNFIQKVCLQNF